MLTTRLCCSCDQIYSYLVVLDGGTYIDKSICRKLCHRIVWVGRDF